MQEYSRNRSFQASLRHKGPERSKMIQTIQTIQVPTEEPTKAGSSRRSRRFKTIQVTIQDDSGDSDDPDDSETIQDDSIRSNTIHNTAEERSERSSQIPIQQSNIYRADFTIEMAIAHRRTLKTLRLQPEGAGFGWKAAPETTKALSGGLPTFRWVQRSS